jgi:hypothetical protein
MNGVPVDVTNKPPLKISLLVTLGFAAIFAPILHRMAMSFPDYLVHSQLAAKMIAEKSIATPHFLYQLIISMMHLGLRIPLDVASFLTILLSVAATTAIVFIYFYRASESVRYAGLFTGGLLLAAPIAVCAPADNHLYFGYIGINVYHNPTILLLKPLAIILYYIVCLSFSPQAKTNGALIGAGVLFTILAASAKPSYTICLIPATLVLALYYRSRKSQVAWTLLVLGILIPSGIILVGQYALTYSSAQVTGVISGDSHVIFAPLMVMHIYSDWLAPKFFLSIAYPLAVAICYWTRVVKEPPVLLAWLCFACGAAYTYLLAESGPRMDHGNFIWSGQITLFILFIASTALLLQTIRLTKKVWTSDYRAVICLCLFIVHSISGILFYAAEFMNSKRFW